MQYAEMRAAVRSGVTDGRTFFTRSGGVWAGTMMRAAINAGRPLTPAVLRTNTTLRRDEWIFFDDQVITAAIVPLRGIADLVASGLVRTIPNGMAKTVLGYETAGTMEPAIVSMDGVTRSELDRVEFGTGGLPMPITHKDFNIDLRTLLASRERGEPLDAMQSRIAGQKVGEMSEFMLFNGGPTFQGLHIYGYLTHPNRNLLSFGTGGNWAQAAKTGAQILTDVLTMVAAAVTDGKVGPYFLYYSSDAVVALSNDFKATGDLSVTQRLLQIPQIKNIQMAEQLPPATVVLVQATVDVVELIRGEALQTVEWEIVGPFLSGFKAFQIEIPLVRADADGKCGIVVMQ